MTVNELLKAYDGKTPVRVRDMWDGQLLAEGPRSRVLKVPKVDKMKISGFYFAGDGPVPALVVEVW